MVSTAATRWPSTSRFEGEALREVAVRRLIGVTFTHLTEAEATAARLKAHAAAAWEEHCPWTESEAYSHCYDLARWTFEGKGQGAKAAELQDETTNMNVPLGGSSVWTEVNNEEWVAFPKIKIGLNGHKYPAWIESGIQSGHGYSETALKWFYAYFSTESGGEIKVTNGWPEEGWHFISFSFQSPRHKWALVRIQRRKPGVQPVPRRVRTVCARTRSRSRAVYAVAAR